MLVNRLQESQTSQQRLTAELGHMRDKYDECLSLFNEARVSSFAPFAYHSIDTAMDSKIETAHSFGIRCDCNPIRLFDRMISV